MVNLMESVINNGTAAGVRSRGFTLPSAGKTGTPVTQSAGSAFTLTVRAVDAYWNLVPTAGPLVSLGSSDAFAAIPAETTLASGQRLIQAKLFRSGPQRIWVSDLDDAAIRPDTSSVVQVVGGPFARVLVLAPGESPAPGLPNGRTGNATDQSINYSFNVTVLATGRQVHMSVEAATQLEGEWTMASGVFSGKPLEETMVKFCKRVTRGNVTAVYAGPQVFLKAKFTLDDPKDPHNLDYVNLQGASAGKSQAGIYELSGATLKICMSAPGEPRPRDFSSKPGDDRTYTTWRLTKK